MLFAGTFTTGGLRVAVEGGELKILREGTKSKFIEQVEQITYSGGLAAETGQPCYYVTERCVFRRIPEGIELVEVAPGVDLEQDILAQMDFRPIVKDPRPMESRIFLPQPMNLERLLTGLSYAERVSYDQRRNILFLNYEGLQLRTLQDIELVRDQLEARCRAIGRKVATIANYDGFELDPAISDAYFAMLTYMQNRYYESVSRYTTSAFMRLKLLNALSERELAPHVFESREEAQAMIER